MVEAPPVDGVAARAERGAATLSRDWLDAMNAHDPAALRALLADDFSWTAGTGPARGADAAVRCWQDWCAATPDLALELVRELGDAEWSILQLRLRGTQRRAPVAVFTARPAADGAATTNIDLPGCAILSARGHRMTRLWTYWDESALHPPRAHPHADF